MSDLPVGEVIEGDCLEVMRGFPDDSLDAIVTDSPYGLEFMGKAWDRLDTAHIRRDREDEMGDPSKRPYLAHSVAYQGGGTAQHFHEAWAREALRVAKPGAFLVAFGGTRTYHRLASGIEDAGWEIRDCLVWAYASGFPKSTNISKNIDRAAGAEREVVGSYRVGGNALTPTSEKGGTYGVGVPNSPAGDLYITAPATDEAKKWAGWGTALKPAWEPIVLARKPFPGTVADNMIKYGTGGLNIDATRIPLGEDEPPYVINTFDDGAKPFGEGAGHPYTSRTVGAPKGREGEPSADKRYTEEGSTNFAATPGPRGGDDRGRWPANVILTDPIFDGGYEGVVGGGERSSGVMKAGTQRASRSVDYGKMPDTANLTEMYGDSGGASRFFLLSAGRISRCDWCGASNVTGSLWSEPQATNVSTAPENVSTKADESPPADASVVERQSGLLEIATAPRRVQTSLSHDDQSGIQQGPLTTSGTESESSPSGRRSTTSPSQRLETSPKSESPLDPANAAEALATLSDITMTTASLRLCDSCAEAVMGRSIPVEASDGTRGSPAALGTYPRFLLIPKAARSEKEPLFNPEDIETTVSLGPMAGRGQPGLKCRKCGHWKVSGSPCVCPEPDFEQTAFVRPPVKNNHPTVKPLDLMCHLVRLVCQPGGIVLDPFLGSGTTAKAAELEGRKWVGIEKDPDYVRIARARLEGTQRGFGLG